MIAEALRALTVRDPPTRNGEPVKELSYNHAAVVTLLFVAALLFTRGESLAGALHLLAARSFWARSRAAVTCEGSNHETWRQDPRDGRQTGDRRTR